MALAYDHLEPLPQQGRAEPDEPLRRPIAPKGRESREPPMETYDHLQTLLGLLEALEWHWRDRHDFFAAGNLTIYYSPNQLKSEDFRGPDFFVVLGTHREPPRKSWVVWDEDGKYPNVIVEVLSESTALVDRGLKKNIYQDVFRTPEYFLFDPATGQLDGYTLTRGRYEPIAPDASGRLRSDELGLLLGVHERKLRLFLPSGEMVPTGIERGLKAEAEAHRAEAEARRAELEAQRAASAEQRAAALAARLRELGVDPDGVK
jgi:Uma2 family endonuclease